LVEHAPGIRLDKWLWHARFFKTRGLASDAVTGGVRVNGVRVTKASTTVRPGDTLAFKQARTARAVRIRAISDRRGPASEAQTLYEDMVSSD
jgi:ribosome-associated heat shock protein Hsp15